MGDYSQSVIDEQVQTQQAQTINQDIGSMLLGVNKEQDYSVAEEAFVKPIHTAEALGDMLLGDQKGAKQHIQDAINTERTSLVGTKNSNMLADTIGMLGTGLATGGATDIIGAGVVAGTKMLSADIAKSMFEKTILEQGAKETFLKGAVEKAISHITQASAISLHQPEAWIKDDGNVGFNKNTAKAIGMNIAIPAAIDAVKLPFKVAGSIASKSKMLKEISKTGAFKINSHQELGSILNKDFVSIAKKDNKFKVEDGFLELNDVNSKIGSKATLDDIAKNNKIENIAIKDGDKFLIKSKKLGVVKGILDSEGTPIGLAKESTILEPRLKYDDKSIFQSGKLENVETDNGTTSKFHSFAQIDKTSKEASESQYTWKSAIVKDNPIANKFRSSIEPDASDTSLVGSLKKTIATSLLNEGSDKSSLVDDFANSVVNKLTDSINKIGSKVSNDEIKIGSTLGELSDTYTDIKGEIGTSGAKTYSGLKKNAKNAIKQATAISFLKLHKLLNKDTFSKSDLQKISSSIVNNFKDLYDIKGDVHFEKFMKDFQQDIADNLFKENEQHTLFESIKQPAKKIKENSKKNEISNLSEPVFKLKDEAKTMISKLTNDFKSSIGSKGSISRYINKAIDQIKNKNQHYVIGRKASFVLNKKYKQVFLTTEEHKYADYMRSVKFLPQISSKKIISLLNKIQKMNDKDLYNFLKDTDKLGGYIDEISEDSFLGKPQFEYIESLRNHIDKIIDFVENNEVDAGISFDVNLDPNTRFRYEGELSPHNSKLMQYLFPPEKSTIDLTKNKTFAKRAILDKIGSLVDMPKKLSKMTDDEVNSFFDNIKKLKKPKTFHESIGVAEFRRLKENPTNTKMPITMEIDGTANGFGMYKAQLGLDNADNKSYDPYNVFVEKINDKLPTGSKFKFTRDDVKPVVTGLIYGQSPANSVKVLIESYINKTLRNKEGSNHILSLMEIFGNKQSLNVFNSSEKLAKLFEIQDKLKKLNAMIENQRSDLDSLSIDKDISSAEIKLNKLLKQQDELYKDINNQQYTIDIYNFYDKVKSNKLNEITEQEFNATQDLLFNSMKNDIIESINEVLPKEILEISKQIESVKTKSFLDFYNRVTNINLGENQVLDMIKSINQELVHKVSNSDIEKIKTEIMTDNRHRLSNKVTRLDVFNYLFKRGILDKDALNMKYVSSFVPTIKNGFEQDVKLVAIKGYAGFDKETGMRYPTFTEPSIISPVLNISHDASIIKTMADAKGGSILSKFDAVFGGENIIETAKNMNTKFAELYKYDNPWDRVIEANNKNTNMELSNNALQYLAEKRLARDDKPFTSENLSNAKKDIQKEIRTNSTDMAKKSEELKLKKQNIDTDQTIDQYTLGGNSTKIKLDEVKEPEGVVDTNKPTVAPLDYTDPSVFDHIESTNKTITWNDALSKMSDLTPADISIEVNTVDGGSSATVGKSINSINISNKDVGSATWFHEIVHEVMHNVYDYYKEKADTAFKFLNDVEIKDSEGNILHEGYIDEKHIDSNERITSILSDLYKNDLAYANKDTLGNVLNKDALKDLVKSYVEIDGHKIHTIKELQQYIKENGKTLDIDATVINRQISQLTRTFRGAMKSSPDLIELFEMNGKKFDKFNSTIKGLDKAKEHFINNILENKVKAKELNSHISSMGWFEAFTFDASKEALESALALNNGLKNLLEETTANHSENINNMLRMVDPTGSADKLYGNAILLGVHKFLDELNSASGLEDFKFKISKVNDEMLATFKNNINDYKTFQKVTKTIKNLAYGNTPKTKIQIAKQLQLLLKHKEAYKNSSYKDFIPMIEKLSAYERLQGNLNGSIKTKSYLVNSLDKFFTNDKIKSAFPEFAKIFKLHENPESLFGENIGLDMSRMSYRAVKNTGKNNKQSVGSFINKKGERYDIVPQKRYNYTVGNQSSQSIDLIPTNFEKGFYKVKGSTSGDIFLNAQNANIKHSVFDNSFSKMTSRNFYLKERSSRLTDYNARQFTLLKQNGLLYTTKEFEQLSPEQQIGFVPLSKSSAIARTRGIHYVNKRYLHYLMGSKGVNLAKAYSSVITNKAFANALAMGTKTLFDYIKILRGTTLVYHAKTYLNSFISSMSLLAVHGGATKLKEAKSLVSLYRNRLTEYSQMALKDQEKANKYFKDNIENDVSLKDIHYAFSSGGLANTIRTNAFKVGTYEENIIYQIMANAGGERFGEFAKSLGADQSTKFGSALGSVFDATEMYPKVALFLHKMEETSGDRAKAVQHVLMAFPTYNNLPPMLNFIDQFSPYTKYAYNIPKMTWYALDQNAKVFAALTSVFSALPALSFAIDANNISDATKQNQEDMHMIKVPMTDTGMSIASMNPWGLDSILDKSTTFAIDASGSNYIDLTLGHHIPTVKSK